MMPHVSLDNNRRLDAQQADVFFTTLKNFAQANKGDGRALHAKLHSIVPGGKDLTLNGVVTNITELCHSITDPDWRRTHKTGQYSNEELQHVSTAITILQNRLAAKQINTQEKIDHSCFKGFWKRYYKNALARWQAAETELGKAHNALLKDISPDVENAPAAAAPQVQGAPIPKVVTPHADAYLAKFDDNMVFLADVLGRSGFDLGDLAKMKNPNPLQRDISEQNRLKTLLEKKIIAKQAEVTATIIRLDAEIAQNLRSIENSGSLIEQATTEGKTKRDKIAKPFDDEIARIKTSESYWMESSRAKDIKAQEELKKAALKPHEMDLANQLEALDQAKAATEIHLKARNEKLIIQLHQALQEQMALRGVDAHAAPLEARVAAEPNIEENHFDAPAPNLNDDIIDDADLDVPMEGPDDLAAMQRELHEFRVQNGLIAPQNKPTEEEMRVEAQLKAVPVPREVEEGLAPRRPQRPRRPKPNIAQMKQERAPELERQRKQQTADIRAKEQKAENGKYADKGLEERLYDGLNAGAKALDRAFGVEENVRV